MIDGWNFKRRSYEYFKFMCRAFLFFKKEPAIAKEMLEDRSTIKRELFSYKNARVLNGKTMKLKD